MQKSIKNKLDAVPPASLASDVDAAAKQDMTLAETSEAEQMSRGHTQPAKALVNGEP
jgi:hypothetical protein